MRCSMIAVFAILCGFVIGCQKTSLFSSVPNKPEVKEKVLPPPAPQTVVQSSVPKPEVPPPQDRVPEKIPTTAPLPIAASVLRLEEDSWFKICLWLTINGQKSDQSFLGCNKGPRKIGSVANVILPPVAEKSDQCAMVGIQAEVHRNTKNCFTDDDCPDESYAREPSYVRHAPGSNSSSMTPFIFRKLGDFQPIDSRIVLTPELIAAERIWAESKVSEGVSTWRVFIEDQSDESFSQATGGRGSWSQLGLDYNDVVIDLQFRDGQNFAGMVNCAR